MIASAFVTDFVTECARHGHLGLRAVEEALQHEVAHLAGARYARDGGEPGLSRWGTQRGSVYVAD